MATQNTTRPQTFEIKNVRRLAGLSEETECFTATLYVDGKRKTTVKNSGHGGPNSYNGLTPLEQQAYDLIAHNWLNENDKGYREYDFRDAHEALDVLVGILCENYENAARMRRLFKKHVLFTLPGDKPGEMRMIQIRPRDGSRGHEVASDYVTKNYPGATFLFKEDCPKTKITIGA